MSTVDTQIEKLQKELDELKAQREAEKKPKPVHIGELLRGGRHWVCYDGAVSSGSTSRSGRSAGAEFHTKESAERAAKARLTRNQVEAWVEQEAEDWEERDCSVYTVCGTWCVIPTERHQIGVILMPKRLARLLCNKLNSGEWTLTPPTK